MSLLRAWRGAGALVRPGARGLASSLPSPKVLEHRAEIRPAHSGPAYTLQVHTGDRRGASTTAKVHARLVGTEGEAGPFSLQGDFYRATMQSFYVETAAPIGQLLRVEIGHDASAVGSGWFLDKVVVQCHSTGLLSDFPCEAWLGESDSGGCDGPLARELHEKQSAVHRESQRGDWSGSARELRLAAAAATLPRTDKVRKGQRSRITAHLGWGGEDAYFIAPRAEGARAGGLAGGAGQWMLGVADGVGSWERQGIDAGKYSRSLIQAALAHFEDVVAQGARAPGAPDALSALEEVVRLACADTAAAAILGSSTLCVVHVDGHAATVSAANIGDSGFIVIRGGAVAYRSAQQEHSFGCPFQLGHHGSACLPTDAQVTSEGDARSGGAASLAPCCGLAVASAAVRSRSPRLSRLLRPALRCGGACPARAPPRPARPPALLPLS